MLQQRLTLLFVLLLFREGPDMGMGAARAPQEQDFVPNPLGNAREGGSRTYVSCGGHWGRNATGPLLCQGMSLMSVCPLPPHKSLPRSFGGGRGPSCGCLQPGGPRMGKDRFSWVQLQDVKEHKASSE